MKRKFKNVEVINDENSKKRVNNEVSNAQSKTSTIKKKKRPHKGKYINFIDTDQLADSFSNVESSEKEIEEETEQLECRESDTNISKKQKKSKRKVKEDLNVSEHETSKKEKKIKQSEDNSSTENDHKHNTDENVKKRKKKDKKTNVDSSHQTLEFTEQSEENESEKQKIDGPTEWELNEAKKPENVIQKKVSVRQQKREKHLKRVIEQKEKNEVATKQNVLNYLSLWKHSRDHWKFEKLKQIWLFNNMFDENKVPDNMWETLIEYINGSKGKARQSLLESATKIIEKAEEQAETEQTEEDSKYKRARNILQCLQE